MLPSCAPCRGWDGVRGQDGCWVGEGRMGGNRVRLGGRTEARIQSLWGTGASSGSPSTCSLWQSQEGSQEGMEGVLSSLQSLLSPFLKLPGWGGDHCGSDLALSFSYPCQLAATSVSPTLAFS